MDLEVEHVDVCSVRLDMNTWTLCLFVWVNMKHQETSDTCFGKALCRSEPCSSGQPLFNVSETSCNYFREGLFSQTVFICKLSENLTAVPVPSFEACWGRVGDGFEQVPGRVRAGSGRIWDGVETS